MNRSASFFPRTAARLVFALAVVVPLTGGEPSCRGAGKSSPSARSWRDPLFYRDVVRRGAAEVYPREFVQMLTAVLTGSQMGPGEGWFHPGQTRYGWKWLAARYDADRDGKVTRKEFPGPAAFFDRLDRNHDGVLTTADFDWSVRSDLARQGRPAQMWFRMIDRDSNGRISRAEWDALFARMAGAKGYVTPDDLRDAFPLAPPPRPPGPPPRNEGPPMGTLIQGLFDGELGSPFEGPRVGQRAYNFRLKTHDGKRWISLADYRGKKPVVLIFGSFT